MVLIPRRGSFVDSEGRGGGDGDGDGCVGVVGRGSGRTVVNLHQSTKSGSEPFLRNCGNRKPKKQPLMLRQDAQGEGGGRDIRYRRAVTRWISFSGNWTSFGIDERCDRGWMWLWRGAVVVDDGGG